MARLARLNLPGIPQHIVQRGNNRQACFFTEQDYTVYLSKLKEYSQKYQRKTQEHGSILINSSPPLIKRGLMFVISKPKYFKFSVTILYL